MRTNDRDALGTTYDLFGKRVPKRTRPTLKANQFLLENIALKVPQAKHVKPESFVELS